MKIQLRLTTLFVAFFSLMQYTSHAQNEALNGGNFMIGSGLGYVNSVTDVQINSSGSIVRGGNSVYQFHITPSIGYFVVRNFSFGLGMDYLLTSSRDKTQNSASNNQRTSDTKLLFGPFARLYLPFGGQQAFFLGAVYGFGKSETEIADAGGVPQTVRTSISTFGAGPGYAIFSNSRVSLEAQAKYNYGISRNTLSVDAVNQTTKTNTTAWDFVVGLHFFFARR